MPAKNSDDDHDLIRALQSGDESAFVKLYKKYCSYTCKVLQSKGVPYADAEDFTQEIWITMHKSLKEFRFDCTFKWFLDVTIRNKFINWIRREKNPNHLKLIRLEAEGGEGDGKNSTLGEMIATARSDAPDQQAIINELLRLLEKCLQQIRNKLKRAAVALKLEGYKIRQIAELLEIKFPHANVNVVRGMTSLRACVLENYVTA